MFVLLIALFIRNEVKRGGKTVTSQELVNLINREKAVVVDIRDSKDYFEGHVPKALNIPFTALQSRVKELEKYKEAPIVVTCKAGQHSSMAGTILRKAGFQNVAKLRGGLLEWRNDNMPIEKGLETVGTGGYQVGLHRRANLRSSFEF